MAHLQKDPSSSGTSIKEKIDEYLHYFNQSEQAALAKRAEHYHEIANHYYDLVTDFYEYAWGPSFHFAYPLKDESYLNAIKRLEHYFALRLGAKKGQKLLDIGCGVGGPMREIARFSGANIVGLNNNLYQIQKGEKYNKALHLDSLCSFLKADYMQRMPYEDNTFDGVYSLEAICYAPDPEIVYAEILRILKPSAYFVGTDWSMTPNYDPNNSLHVRIKEGIAKGDGLADLYPSSRIIEGLRKVGFQNIEGRDLSLESETPWYEPLESKLSFKGFRRSSTGRIFTTQLLRTLEFFRIAPEGSTKVSEFLNVGADNLVRAGQLDIFTPGYLFIAQKPR